MQTQLPSNVTSLFILYRLFLYKQPINRKINSTFKNHFKSDLFPRILNVAFVAFCELLCTHSSTYNITTKKAFKQHNLQLEKTFHPKGCEVANSNAHSHLTNQVFKKKKKLKIPIDLCGCLQLRSSSPSSLLLSKRLIRVS